MRVVLASCMFAKTEIIEASYAQMEATISNQIPVERWFLDQHWPMKKQATKNDYRRLAGKHRAVLLDAGKNLGLHVGYNYIFHASNLQDDDVVICYDPDLWPLTPGWDLALATVLKDPKIVWASTTNKWVDREAGAWNRKVVNGINVQFPDRAHIQSLCAFKGWWLKKIGWFHEPSAFYGGLESYLHSKLGKEKNCYLSDFRDDTEHFIDQIPPEYREYKWKHAHEGSWPGDLESFLQANYPKSL